MALPQRGMSSPKGGKEDKTGSKRTIGLKRDGSIGSNGPSPSGSVSPRSMAGSSNNRLSIQFTDRDGIHLFLSIPSANGYSQKLVPDLPLQQLIVKYQFLLPPGSDPNHFHFFHNGLRMMDEERKLSSYGVKPMVFLANSIILILTRERSNLKGMSNVNWLTLLIIHFILLPMSQLEMPQNSSVKVRYSLKKLNVFFFFLSTFYSFISNLGFKNKELVDLQL